MGTRPSEGLSPKRPQCVAGSRTEPPILKYDRNGRLLKAWGEGLFNFPHGAALDSQGNLVTQDGLFVTTMIRVKNMDNLRDARTALQRMITQNNIGSVQELPAARAFLVTDFAPNVVAIYRTIRRMDVLPEARPLRTEFFELKHAAAQSQLGAQSS